MDHGIYCISDHIFVSIIPNKLNWRVISQASFVFMCVPFLGPFNFYLFFCCTTPQIKLQGECLEL